MPEKNLDYYLNLPYTMLSGEAGGSCYFYIPDLSLFAEGPDFDQAYKAMRAKKEEFFRRVIELNLHDTVTLPQPVKLRNALSFELISTAVKSVIIAVVLGFVFLTGILFVNDLVVKRLLIQAPRKAKIYVNRIVSKIEHMSPQEKEALRQKIATIAAEIRPLLDALQDENGSDIPQKKAPKYRVGE